VSVVGADGAVSEGAEEASAPTWRYVSQSFGALERKCIPPPPVDWTAVVESPARRNAAGLSARHGSGDAETRDPARSAKDETTDEAFILVGQSDVRLKLKRCGYLTIPTGAFSRAQPTRMFIYFGV
jgi:hypothetical protein